MKNRIGGAVLIYLFESELDTPDPTVDEIYTNPELAETRDDLIVVWNMDEFKFKRIFRSVYFYVIEKIMRDNDEDVMWYIGEVAFICKPKTKKDILEFLFDQSSNINALMDFELKQLLIELQQLINLSIKKEKDIIFIF